MGRLTEALAPRHSTRQRYYLDTRCAPKSTGPLGADWSPLGLSRREIAAARACQLLMEMRKSGETPQLARRFDCQCRILDPTDDGDYGSILRSGIFNDGADIELTASI